MICAYVREREQRKGEAKYCKKLVKYVICFWCFFSLKDSPQSNVIPLTEENWSDVTQVDGYSKSKTLAEKAAWVFVKDLPGTSRASVVQISVPLHAYNSS